MLVYCGASKSEAIKNRNNIWRRNKNIPKWVDIENVGLDQFFTKPEIAKYCYENLLSFILKDGGKEAHFKFIEPSAGAGAFYDLLPKDRRIGIDILPFKPDIIKQDFLSWSIKPNGYNYVTIGNPPFGYRAWLALAFMNHAANFSDYVGMILPMSFQSDGKGSSKHRVKNLKLIHSEVLPKDSFIDPYGKQVKINALWQVWKKGINTIEKEKSCSEWIELFTVDNRKERLCGQKRIHEADFFLQRTFYKNPPILVKSFSEVKYVCGYGIIIKKDKEKIISLLQNANWKKYSNLAAHNCKHISMYHIQRVLTEAGYVDV